MKDTFSGKQAICETNHLTDIKDLNAKIGQLTVERDFFKERLQTIRYTQRQEMIDHKGKSLSLSRQLRPFKHQQI